MHGILTDLEWLPHPSPDNTMHPFDNQLHQIIRRGSPAKTSTLAARSLWHVKMTEHFESNCTTICPRIGKREWDIAQGSENGARAAKQPATIFPGPVASLCIRLRGSDAPANSVGIPRDPLFCGLLRACVQRARCSLLRGANQDASRDAADLHRGTTTPVICPCRRLLGREFLAMNKSSTKFRPRRFGMAAADPWLPRCRRWS